jgi:uncharacterized membrane protein (UPF0182 family)
VILGNLITLPVAGTLIYEEPVYIQGTGSTGGSASGSYPGLKRVLVSLNGQVAIGPTLQDALNLIFSGVAVGGSGGSSGSGTGSGSGSGAGSVSAAVRGDLQQAEADYAKAQAALKSGDFASYGKYTALMKQALDQAQQASQGHPSPSPRATPSPSASR